MRRNTDAGHPGGSPRLADALNRVFRAYFARLRGKDVSGTELHNAITAARGLGASATELERAQREAINVALDPVKPARGRRSRRNGRGAPLDQRAADELKLFIDNDGQIYGQGRMYRAALEKRMQKGQFSIVLAAKGFEWIVDEGAKKYAKDFGGTWNTLFSPATRKQVAKEMAEEWANEYRIQHPTKNSRRKRMSRRNGSMNMFDARDVIRHVRLDLPNLLMQLLGGGPPKVTSSDWERYERFVSDPRYAGTFQAMTNIKSRGYWASVGVNQNLTQMLVQVQVGGRTSKRTKDFYFPLTADVWPEIKRQVTEFVSQPVRNKRTSRRNAGKLFRFPEGVMTETEWVQRHADRVEEFKVDWTAFFDRRKFNQMGGHGEQEEYEARLKKKAEKPLYRAWKGDTYQIISKSTYDAAPARLKQPMANARKRTSRRSLRRNAMYLPAGTRVVHHERGGAATVRQWVGDNVQIEWDGGPMEWVPVSEVSLVAPRSKSGSSRRNPRRRRTSRRVRRTSRRAA